MSWRWKTQVTSGMTNEVSPDVKVVQNLVSIFTYLSFFRGG